MRNKFFINGVSVISGDSSVDMSGMDKIFAGKKIEAKQLREKAWQRGPLTKEDIISEIKEARKGSFYTSEEVKKQIKKRKR
jgi:hypothetical protein